MKKINILEFCNEIQENLETFQEEMITRNFSNRNQSEWFRLLGDYLGILPKFEIDDDYYQINQQEDPKLLSFKNDVDE